MQQLVYRLCKAAVTNHTAELVVEMEAAIGGEDLSRTPQLPQVLITHAAEMSFQEEVCSVLFANDEYL